MNCLGVNPKYLHLNLTNPPDKHSCLFLGLYEIFRWSHMCISLHVADSGWDFDMIFLSILIVITVISKTDPILLFT